MKFKTNKNRKNFKDEDHVLLAEQVSNYDWSIFDNFNQIPISSKTKHGLRSNNYIKPTDIQKQSIGYALCGNDILGAAKTGSGKTLAFLIPMLECLYKNQWTALDGIGALIISPTRELAYQIFEVLKKVGAEHDFSAGLIIGGKDLNFERKRMDRCNIVVCTPGRLLQHMDENPIFNCDNLKILILDEADRILDLGFAKTMNAIIENLPAERQTLLFSATQTKSVKDLARLSLKNPIYVSSHEHEKHSTPETLLQKYIICSLQDKINLLWSFIKQHNKQKIIVFMSSCKQVKYFYELFCHLRPGIPLLALYGTLHQMRRMTIYDKFCQSSKTVLFATDIASRGLDFPSVNWVVQLDCPEDVTTYIHRVGRTARFENGGQSLLVLLPSEEEAMIKQLTDKKVPIEKIKVNSKKMTNIQRKVEAFLARDVSLKETAQRAFKAYLKNVFLMKDKSVFKYDQLDLNEYARSLGLMVTPRVRFVERKLTKNKEKIASTNVKCQNNYSDNECQEKSVKKLENNDEIDFRISDNELDDEDFFKVKNVWHFDQESNEEINATESNLIERKKAKKVLTKAAVTKRLLKKNIKLNTKIVFDENSNAVIEGGCRKQSSQFVKELDKVDSGIDIEIAKKIMQDEDKIDKKLYRDIVKEKHLKKKLKMKEKKNKGKDFEKSVQLNEEEDDYDMTRQFIDALPDPDKLSNNYNDDNDYSSNNLSNQSVDDQEDQLDEKSFDTFDDNVSKTKRSYLETFNDKTKNTTNKKKKKINDISYYENLALKLISK